MTVVEDLRADGPLAYTNFRTIPAQVTIKHWQLKNLICLNSSPPRPTSDSSLSHSTGGGTSDEILYVCRHSVRTLDPRTNRIGLLAPKLSFEPRSLCSRYGFTVAGSEQGRIAVMHGGAASGEKHEEEIGQSLVNGLHIYRAPDGARRVLVSSNDWTIQIYNLESMRKESLVRCPTAVNYASVSPDGRMMAAVGDSLDAYIYVLESGGWKRQTTFPVANDASFMASFSTAGDKLAIASQAGVLPIYDVRMLSANRSEDGVSHASVASAALLHTIKSSRRGSRRFPHVAVRSVQWSPSPLDLLLFTEENSRATLVDGRDFTRTQDLNVPAMDRLPHSRLAGTPQIHHHYHHGGDRDHGQQQLQTSSAQHLTGYDLGDRELSGACFSNTGDRVYVATREDISEWNVKTYGRRTFSAMSLR